LISHLYTITAANLLDSMSDTVLVLDMEGKILHTNPTLERKFGYSSSELHGTHILELELLGFLKEEYREKVMQTFDAAILEESSLSIEVPLRTKTGEKIEGSLSSFILPDSTGNPVGFVAVFRDLSKLKVIER